MFQKVSKNRKKDKYSIIKNTLGFYFSNPIVNNFLDGMCVNMKEVIVRK